MKCRSIVTLFALSILLSCSSNDERIAASDRLTHSAEILMKHKKWVVAQDSLIKSVQLNTNNKVAYSDLAICRLKQDAPFDSVVYYFNIAKKIDSSFVTPYLNLADCYLQKNQYQQAVDQAVMAIKRLDSTDNKERLYLSMAFDIAGNVLNKTGNYTVAEMSLLKAIWYDHHNMNAYRHLGFSYLKTKHYREGIKFSTIALEDDTADIPANENRGLCYAYLKEFDLAMQDENRAIRISPDSCAGYHFRGLVFKEMGNHKKAIEDFTKAIALGSIYAKADLDSLENGKSN